MAQSKRLQAKQIIQARELKIRFVYEGEIKGEWINGLAAYENGFMAAHPEMIVTRIEIEQEERPPRIRVEPK